MRPIPIDFNEIYSVLIYNGHEYLFTSARIDRDSVPEGLYVYDVRDGDTFGEPETLTPHPIMANHWGTAIGTHELPLEDGWGCYVADKETDGMYASCGGKTLVEYMEE